MSINQSINQNFITDSGSKIKEQHNNNTNKNKNQKHKKEQ